MNTLEFSIQVNAPRERVWESLWSDAGYRYWTTAFMEGSYAETDWREGSKVRFITPDGSGMYSVIEKNEAPSEMSFVHQGEVKGGTEQPPAPWAGARERYTLTEQGSGTRVTAFLDSNEEMAAYFEATFPKAFDRLKTYAEGSASA